MSEIIQYNEQIFLTSATIWPELDIRVNGAVLLGRKFNIVWDTFAYPEDMEQLASILDGKPAVAIYSHADWDHCWGACGYPFSMVIACKDAERRFKNELPMTLNQMNREFKNAYKNVRLIAPNKLITEKRDLDLGSYCLELHPFCGHTSDSMIGYIPQFGLFLGGDAVETIPVVNDKANIPTWCKNLSNWCEHDWIKAVWPGHGEICGAEIFTENRRYLRVLKKRKAEVPADISPFYQQIHSENIEKMSR